MDYQGGFGETFGKDLGIEIDKSEVEILCGDCPLMVIGDATDGVIAGLKEATEGFTKE